MSNHNNDANDFLSDRNKGVDEARNVLARMFRQMLRDLRIDHAIWHRKMMSYLSDSRRVVAPTSKERAYARGNLNKELRRPRMTWRTFSDKAIPFLNPLRIRFIIEADWPNGKTTRHMTTLDRAAYALEEHPEDHPDESEKHETTDTN